MNKPLYYRIPAEARILSVQTYVLHGESHVYLIYNKKAKAGTSKFTCSHGEQLYTFEGALIKLLRTASSSLIIAHTKEQ